MEQQQLSAKTLKQRKFLMVLPALVLPFLTFFFWFLGGGQVQEVEASGSLAGINPEVPTARVADQPADKLRYYELAEQDSARRAEQQRKDPYYNHYEFEGAADEMEGLSGNLNTSVYPASYDGSPEARVMEKLEQLGTALKTPETPATSQQITASYSLAGDKSLSTDQDIERLAQMMERMQAGGMEEDPETQQLQVMLESILDIQHPERVQERLRQTSLERAGEVFAVDAYEPEDPISVLAADHEGFPLEVSASQGNGFFSLDEQTQGSQSQNAIEAVVHEGQTLTSGTTVKLRLLSDVFINGIRIPKDNFVFGKANLNGERLEVSIDHVRSGASLFPVSLSVYDLDGMAGIRIPGAISRDVMKQSGGQSLQSVGIMSMNPSLGAQAATAGIELGKNLLSRKIKLVKVQVKAGYKVLLMDNNRKQTAN